MATTKAKTKPRAKKQPASQPAKAATKKSVAAKTIVSVEPNKTKKPNALVSRIFGRKYDNKDENILTIFKSPKIIGAVLAELIGTMLLAMVIITLGIVVGYFDAMFMFFVMLALSVVLFAISGANINPIITIGLMATRRMAPIRGVLYIIAQVLGAWLGLLIVNAFVMFNPELGHELPRLAELTLSASETGAPSTFWALTFVELIGAVILGFFFARAVAYKRSAFTFAAVVAGGAYITFTLATYFTVVLMGMPQSSHVYMFNPALAIMFQVLPTTGADFGDLMGKIGIALTTYVLAPALGACVGMYLSDTSAALSDTPAEQ